jgi:hypothetical protein
MELLLPPLENPPKNLFFFFFFTVKCEFIGRGFIPPPLKFTPSLITKADFLKFRGKMHRRGQ